MKNGATLAIAALGALAVAGVLHSQTTGAGSGAGTGTGTGTSSSSGQNPSGATSGQNPGATGTQNPSQTVPGQNPSQTTNPPTLPNSGLPTPTAPGVDATLTDRVRTAVIQSAPTSSGVPSSSAPGISVNDFRVTTGADGRVVLRGVVHSAKERSDAEARAASVVGTGNVVNQLEVR